EPRDGLQMRVYLASCGLWLTLDAGRFEEIDLNIATGAVRAGLASATTDTVEARMRIEQPAKIAGAGTYHPRPSFPPEGHGFVIPRSARTTWVELTQGRP